MQDQNSQKEETNHEDVCEIYHPHEDSIERAKKHVLDDDEYSDLSEFFKIFGNKKRALNLISALNGDPCENRTRVTAVKGPCLNRLTNGPLW